MLEHLVAYWCLATTCQVVYHRNTVVRSVVRRVVLSVEISQVLLSLFQRAFDSTHSSGQHTGVVWIVQYHRVVWHVGGSNQRLHLVPCASIQTLRRWRLPLFTHGVGAALHGDCAFPRRLRLRAYMASWAIVVCLCEACDGGRRVEVTSAHSPDAAALEYDEVYVVGSALLHYFYLWLPLSLALRFALVHLFHVELLETECKAPLVRPVACKH